MKRSLSQASPPPENAGSPGSNKPTRPKKSKKARLANAGSPPPPAIASSPPYTGGIDSPGPRRRSRSRSRSGSAAPTNVGFLNKGKGKEEELNQEAPDDAEEDEQEEEEELLFSDDEFGMNQKESTKQKEHLRVLLNHFDAEQMDRYEAYRRSGLNKTVIRRLVNSVLQQSVSAPVLTVVRGFAKVFVGEVVEKARSIANHDGPLTPEDLRKGYRLYQDEHERVISAPQKRKLFVR